MNKVILTGRLTRDPEVRYSQGDNPLCIAKFSLAVNRKYAKDGEQNADFLNCTAFGKTGEFVEKYFRKGMKADIEGRLQTGSYEKDGVKHYTTDVIIEGIEFGESKKAGSENADAKATGNEDFMSVPENAEDALPFN